MRVWGVLQANQVTIKQNDQYEMEKTIKYL